MVKVVSWNIAGLRHKANKLDNLLTNYDIVCFQETRLSNDVKLPLFKNWSEFHAVNKGVKGCTTITNNKMNVDVKEKYHNSFNKDSGRILIISAEFTHGKTLFIFNVYLPYVSNAKNKTLIKHKKDMLNFVKHKIIEYKKKGYVILCMDGNIARSTEEYDIYPSHPKPSTQPSFRPDEIKIYEDFMYDVDDYLIDTQATVLPNKIHYSFFSKRTTKKNIFWDKNMGLTNDFIMLDKRLESNIKNFHIDYSFREYSDHCPLVLTFDF